MVTMQLHRHPNRRASLAILGVLVAGTWHVCADELKQRCGDCWCIYYGEFNECPNGTGISDTFPESYSIYKSFELMNPEAPYLSLRTPEGEECSPFAYTLGPLNGYPQSYYPQCTIPQQTFDTVCAYKFENGTQCLGRKYEILTYDSAQAAQDDGAIVTHRGACGVCSNAQDLWARMKTIDEFEAATIVCATIYILSPDDDEKKFDDLVQCAMKGGLSPECALLYAHLGAATVKDCADACQAEVIAGTGETNLPPPTCELTPCNDCPSSWNMFFDEMAGRTMERSGITENTAKRCSLFSRIEHDPCVGALDTAEDAFMPASSSCAQQSTLSFLWLTTTLIAIVALSSAAAVR